MVPLGVEPSTFFTLGRRANHLFHARDVKWRFLTDRPAVQIHLLLKMSCDPSAPVLKLIGLFVRLVFFSAELGDCDPLDHNLDLVTEFRFVPNQTEDMELAIYNTWKDCRWGFYYSTSTTVLTAVQVQGQTSLHFSSDWTDSVTFVNENPS